MKIEIELTCPSCQSPSIKKNGIKPYGKQNYFCKDCKRQFVGNHNLTYKGCSSDINDKIKLMLVRGCGIRDIATILSISLKKVLSVLVCVSVIIKPKQSHYDCLEVDEFWTYVKEKKRKYWFIYAYHRETGEIVAYVWGKRDAKTAKKLRKKLKELAVTYDQIASDNWDSFIHAFAHDNHITGKKHTVGIEGNNCRLRHRIRRVFRKTCCFSKKPLNHLKAFDLTIFYINYGYV